jgi:hypothetical protein
VRDGHAGPRGHRRRRDPGAQRQRRAGQLGAGLGEEHGEAAAPVWALLPGVAHARGQGRRVRHVRARVVRGHHVVGHREGRVGIAGQELVVLLDVLVRPRRRLLDLPFDRVVAGVQQRRRGVGDGGVFDRRDCSGPGVVAVLVAADELAGEERVALHDLLHVVPRDVEVGDGVQAAELDRRNVVRLGRLLLRGCTKRLITNR